MSKYQLILYGIIFAVVLAAGYKLASYVNNLKTDNGRLHTELVGQQEKYKQLTDYVAKLEVQYKSEEDLRKDTEAKFKDQMAELQGRIKVLSDATFLIKSNARDTKNSDVVFSGPDSKFVLNEIRYDDGPPVGYVLIFDDGRVVSKLYNHEINVSEVVSKDETSGRYSILSKADYILKSPSLNQNGKSWLNQPYALKITGGSAEVDPTEPIIVQNRFYFWNPKLNANLNTNLDGLYPGANISIMSYGVSKNDSNWKFIGVGAQQVGTEIQPTITPIMWRPFSGLLSNTYVGPGAYLSGTEIKYFLGLQVEL